MRNGDDGIAVRDQPLQNAWQGFGRVLRRIVEQDDAPGLHLLQHPLRDLLGGDPLPVETIAACNK